MLHEDVLQHLLFARLELRNLAGDEAEKARVMTALDSATHLVRELVGTLRPPTPVACRPLPGARGPVTRAA